MKAAMALLNTIDLGPVRLPNEPISPKSIEIMKKELKSLGFHLNENTN